MFRIKNIRNSTVAKPNPTCSPSSHRALPLHPPPKVTTPFRTQAKHKIEVRHSLAKPVLRSFNKPAPSKGREVNLQKKVISIKEQREAQRTYPYSGSYQSKLDRMIELVREQDQNDLREKEELTLFIVKEREKRQKIEEVEGEREEEEKERKEEERQRQKERERQRKVQEQRRKKEKEEDQKRELQLRQMMEKVHARKKLRQQNRIKQQERERIAALHQKEQTPSLSSPQTLIAVADPLTHLEITEHLMDQQIKLLLTMKFSGYPNESALIHQLDELERINSSYLLVRQDPNNSLLRGLSNYRVELFNRVGELVVEGQKKMGSSASGLRIVRENDVPISGIPGVKATRGIQSRIQEVLKTKQLEEETDCPICLGGMSRGESVYEVGCGHLFHRQCLENWLATTANCPACRYNIKFGHP